MADKKIIDLERLQQFLSKCDARYIRFGKKVYDGTLGAGTSDLAGNFDTKLVYNDNLAYNFRTTAGGEEVANQIKQKAIVGGSLGWNNVLSVKASVDDTKATFTNTNGICGFAFKTHDEVNYTFTNDTSFQLCLGHKYLIPTWKSNDAPSTLAFVFRVWLEADSTHSRNFYDIPIRATEYVFNCTTDNNSLTKDRKSTNAAFTKWTDSLSSYVTVTGFPAMLIDLTACFGPTIADYIYSLEQATAGAGVAWFKRYFPKPYYPYQAIGGFAHVQTKGKKYVMFNQLKDNVSVSGNNAVFVRKALDNPVRVLPIAYCFSSVTTASQPYAVLYDENMNIIGEGYVRTSHSSGRKYGVLTMMREGYVATIDFYYNGSNASAGTFTYNDICINPHWDGERDGEYEPYKENVYDVDPIELLGIPHIDAQGNLYFEGNRYNSDGTVEEEYDIATIDGTNITAGFKGTASNGNNFYLLNISNAKLPANNQTAPEVTCPNYGVYSLDVVRYGETVVQGFTANTGDGLWLAMGSSSDFDTAAKVNAWLANHPITIIYKLATPTTSEANPFTELQIGDNWGTEEWLAPDNDTRPVEVPVGNDTDYLPDLKAKLETAPANPDTDGDYVMHRESGENSYIPLATWLLANGYPQANVLASKDALGGTLRQVLAANQSVDFLNTDFVDMGDLEWRYRSGEGVFTLATVLPSLKTQGKILCSKYKSNIVSYISMSNLEISSYNNFNDHDLIVKDSAYTDVTAFKAAMKGVLLAYEKAE